MKGKNFYDLVKIMKAETPEDVSKLRKDWQQMGNRNTTSLVKEVHNINNLQKNMSMKQMAKSMSTESLKYPGPIDSTAQEEMVERKRKELRGESKTKSNKFVKSIDKKGKLSWKKQSEVKEVAKKNIERNIRKERISRKTKGVTMVTRKGVSRNISKSLVKSIAKKNAANNLGKEAGILRRMANKFKNYKSRGGGGALVGRALVKDPSRGRGIGKVK